MSEPTAPDEPEQTSTPRDVEAVSEGPGGNEPSSHETAGDDPAGDVAGDNPETKGGEEPSSHETAGDDPAGDVAGSSSDG